MTQVTLPFDTDPVSLQFDELYLPAVAFFAVCFEPIDCSHVASICTNPIMIMSTTASRKQQLHVVCHHCKALVRSRVVTTAARQSVVPFSGLTTMMRPKSVHE